jgi:hypothetical protein
MSYPNKAYTRLGPITYFQNLQTAIFTPPTNAAVCVGKVVVLNHSGGAINVGLSYQVPAGQVSCFSYDYNGGAQVVADVSTSAKSTTTNAWSVVAATTGGDNDGFILQAQTPFDAFSFVLDSNAAGAGTVVYKTGTGAGWSATATSQVVAFTAAGTNASYQYSVAVPTMNWAPGCGETGTSNTAYQLFVQWTTGPTTRAVKASALKLYKFITIKQELAEHVDHVEDFGGGEYKCPMNAPLVPWFSGTANANNAVAVDYRLIG